MSTELARNPVATLATFLDKQKANLQRVVGAGLTTERAIGVLLACVARTPKLQTCTPLSIYNCLHAASALGLELGSPLGHAYPVPFGDQATLIVGYKGLLKLARDGGDVRGVEARIVRAKDRFTLRYGLTPVLEHTPSLEPDAGEVLGAYAIARLPDGAAFDFMSAAEIDAIRDRDKRRRDAVARGDSPWATDYEEMAKKTVLRRLCKVLPLSPVAEEKIAAADVHDVTPAIDTTATVAVEPQEPKARRAPAPEPAPVAAPEAPPPATDDAPEPPDAAEPSAALIDCLDAIAKATTAKALAKAGGYIEGVRRAGTLAPGESEALLRAYQVRNAEIANTAPAQTTLPGAGA